MGVMAIEAFSFLAPEDHSDISDASTIRGTVVYYGIDHDYYCEVSLLVSC